MGVTIRKVRSKQGLTSGCPIYYGNDRFPTAWFRQHAIVSSVATNLRAALRVCSSLVHSGFHTPGGGGEKRNPKRIWASAVLVLTVNALQTQELWFLCFTPETDVSVSSEQRTQTNTAADEKNTLSGRRVVLNQCFTSCSFVILPLVT